MKKVGLSLLILLTGSSLLKGTQRTPFVSLAAQAIFYKLENLIEPMIREDYDKVQEILDFPSMPYSHKAVSIYTHTIEKRLLGIKEAAATNDFKRIQKLLIDHSIWRLEIAIENSDKNNVYKYTAAIAALGPPTDKQTNKLAACKEFATTINNERKESTNWDTYFLLGCAGVHATIAGCTTYMKANTFTIILGGIVTLHGAGALWTNYSYKNTLADAVTIEYHIHSINKSTQ